MLAAQQPTSPAGSDSEATVTLAIVTALELEAQPLRELLSQVTTFRPAGRTVSVGRLGDTSIAVVAGGVGQRASASATRLLIDGHQPKWIISAGLCGGLVAELSRNQTFVPDMVIAGDGPERIPLDVPPCLRDCDVVCGGSLVTADRVIVTPDDKRSLHERSSALAVDMESLGVAREAAASGVRTSVVRVVCDALNDRIPEDIATLLAYGSGARQAGAAVRLAWRRPSSIVELAELRERAHLAAQQIDPVLKRLAATCGS